jgi:DNA mismatch endonuclease (patch repair protein)
MSAIKGTDTKPELILRKSLWSLGFRYRVGHKLPGKPDLVFVSRKSVIFVDGCFWHRCPDHFRMPKSNREFWEKKIARNVNRDKNVTAQLEALGWRVLRVWEHDIKDSEKWPSTLKSVIDWLEDMATRQS